ncbi:hypothetical protein [Pedobacter endophyticus]|uniref:Uncharacterized protein n=1 Tax=Pedobacter endophyticus TaxID=2789740 RepID=A0A7S9KY17_9SPHI|nr:hypothetical protein [Pedobacter endophyticus]QPH38934.1 hypothetical protein IZT61_17995 [Pedobacter endophyticus]
MICIIVIDEIAIGEANLQVIDEAMGVIGGRFVPFHADQKFQHVIQVQCEMKRVSNINDFNYKIRTGDNVDLHPSGGVGITDLKGINEIYIESAGINLKQIKIFK